MNVINETLFKVSSARPVFGKTGLIILLILFQIQFFLMSYETYLNQLDSDLNNIDKFFQRFLRIFNMTLLDFPTLPYFKSLRFMILVLFLLAQLVFFSFAPFVLKSTKKDIFFRLSNVFKKLHSHLFWLPVYNYAIRLIKDAMDPDLNVNKGALFAVGTVMLVVNFALLYFNVSVYQVVRNQLTYARFNNHYIYFRIGQGIVISGLNMIAYENSDSTSLIYMILILNIILEIFSKGILIQSFPYYEYEFNVASSIIHNASLITSVSSLVHMWFDGTKTPSWNNKIVYLIFIFFPLLLKIEISYFQRKRNDIKEFFNSETALLSSGWQIQRLFYLKNIIILKNLFKNFGSEDRITQILFIELYKKQNENDLYEELYNEKNLHFTFFNFLRKLADKYNDPRWKILVNQYLYEESLDLNQVAVSMIEISNSRNFDFVTKVSAQYLLYQVQDVIAAVTSHTDDNTDIHVVFECFKIHEELKKDMLARIHQAHSIYSLIEKPKPSLRYLLNLLRKFRQTETSLEKHWQDNCAKFFKHRHILLLEYSFYSLYVDLDYYSYRKYLTEYNKYFDEISKHNKTPEIDKQNILSTSNVTVIIHSDDKSLGKVCFASSNIHEVFGLSRKYLEGKNINLLMPEFLHEVHDKLMRKKLNSTHSISKRSFVQSYAKDKDGYLKRVHIYNSFLPDISSGVKIFGLIRCMVADSKILLIDESGDILGYTRAFGEEFSLQSSRVPRLSILSPDLYDTLKLYIKGSIGTVSRGSSTSSSHGVSVQLPTSILSYRFTEMNSKQESKFNCSIEIEYVDKKRIIVVKLSEDFKSEYDFNVEENADISPKKKNMSKKSIESNEISECNERNGDTRILYTDQKFLPTSMTIRKFTKKVSEEIYSEIDFHKNSVEEQLTLDAKNSAKTHASTRSSTASKHELNEIFQLSNFYRALDVSWMSFFLIVPFVTFFGTIFAFYLVSDSCITHIQKSLAVQLNTISLERSFYYLTLNTIFLYNSNSGIPFMNQPAIKTAADLIRVVKAGYSDNIKYLSPEAIDLFYKNLTVYDPMYVTVFNKTNHHAGNMISVIDELLSYSLYATNFTVARAKNPRKFAYALNFLANNINNDIIFSLHEFSVKLFDDSHEYVNKIHRDSLGLILVNTAIIAVIILLLGINLYRVHKRNVKFFDAFFSSDFSSEIEVQKENLHRLKQAIETHNFDSLLEFKNKPKFTHKKSAKLEKFIVRHHEVSTESIGRVISAGAFLLLLLLGITLGIVLAAGISLINSVEDAKNQMNDVYNSWLLLFGFQNLLKFEMFYIFRKDLYVKKNPIKLTLNKEVENLNNLLGEVSSTYSLQFQEKYFENVCMFYANDTVCPRIASGIALKGIVPSLINALIALQTFNSRNGTIVLNSTVSVSSFQYIQLLNLYVYPRFEILVKETSGQVTRDMEDGLKAIVKYIIVGVISSLLLRLFCIRIWLPYLNSMRKDSYKILMTIPLRNLLASRYLKEFLIKDSKDFYHKLVREAEKETNLGIRRDNSNRKATYIRTNLE